MLDENQIVKVKWNNANRKWYENKGYKYSKNGNEFEVAVKNLPPSAKVRVNMICDYCGSEYDSWYYAVMYSRKAYPKDACAHCAGKKSSDISIRKRAKKYIGQARKICEELGYILLTTEDEFTDVKMQIKFICPIHGERSMMLDNFLRGHRCAKCGRQTVANLLKHAQDYVKECIEFVNGNKWLNYGEYINSSKHNLIIQCSCGNIFTTCFVNYVRAQVNTCSICSHTESKGEQRIRELLDNYNIVYEQEKRFDDCRDKKPLPFDFYLPDYNLICEYDGLQHFEDVPMLNHKRTVAHDNIKNEYCKLHNIDLLRIPYWDFDNIENILKEKLSL